MINHANTNVFGCKRLESLSIDCLAQEEEQNINGSGLTEIAISEISEIAISPQSHNLTIPEFFPGRDGSPRSRIPGNLEKSKEGIRGGGAQNANC